MQTSIKKLSFTGLLAGVAALLFTATSFAHVTVKPSAVPTASYQVFTVNVPNEKEIPTTGVRLVIPDSISGTTPTQKAGWTITTKTEGSGDNEKVTEITWAGGEIVDGTRDEFSFSARVPAENTDLQWKAYQTYSDGTVVAWDKEDEGGDSHSGGNSGPLSVTKVTNDADEDTVREIKVADDTDKLPLYIAGAALFVSLIALLFASRKKQ